MLCACTSDLLLYRHVPSIQQQPHPSHRLHAHYNKTRIECCSLSSHRVLYVNMLAQQQHNTTARVHTCLHIRIYAKPPEQCTPFTSAHTMQTDSACKLQSMGCILASGLIVLAQYQHHDSCRCCGNSTSWQACNCS